MYAVVWDNIDVRVEDVLSSNEIEALVIVDLGEMYLAERKNQLHCFADYHGASRKRF